MFHRTRKPLSLIGLFPILLSVSILICSGVTRAQETGGDLSGGAGIFRPKIRKRNALAILRGRSPGRRDLTPLR